MRSITDAEILFQRLAGSRPDAFSPYLARSLNIMGLVMSDLGLNEAAIKSTAEAESIFRQLAEKRPDAFKPELAQGLAIRGTILSQAGLRDQAQDHTRQAVELYRSLVDGRPEQEMLLPALAESLNQMAEILALVGEPEKAWESVQEALRIILPFFVRVPSVYRGIAQRAKLNYERIGPAAGRDVDHRLLAVLGQAISATRQLKALRR